MLSLCDRIGAPIKTEKVKGPTTCLTFWILYLIQTLWKPIFQLNAKITVNLHPFFLHTEKCTKHNCYLLLANYPSHAKCFQQETFFITLDNSFVVFCATPYNMLIMITHIAGVDDVIADVIS